MAEMLEQHAHTLETMVVKVWPRPRHCGAWGSWL